MGFFDKLKKAFSVENEDEVNKKQNNDSHVEDAQATVDDAPSTEQTDLKSSEATESINDFQEDNQKEDSELTYEENVNEVETQEDVIEENENLDVNEDSQTQVQETKQEEIIENKSQEELFENTSETKQENDETQAYDKGLEKSRSGLGSMINSLLANFRKVDEDFFEELEETLIEADVGFENAMRISEALRQEVKLRNAKKKSEVSDAIVRKMVELYEEDGKKEDSNLHFASNGPTVFLFVGVNGVGKTTTIGKLAYRYKQEGKRVLLCAADTFRAGAIEQLAEWGNRVGVDVVKKPEKSDPASVVFDAVAKVKEGDYDILLVDTAGRLQNKVNLMNELEKISRIIKREIPDAPHEVLLALDATTGQNALIQAKEFKSVTNVSGIVLTKLDGTAKGGIVLGIRSELHIPVKLVGLGEQMQDLRIFNAKEYIEGLFGNLISQDK
ncbi:cell division protein FtsY [Ligilactobacillus hayakitensis DSM 18933 = JCM 14209]|uniref:Signal recognition particle receptor FtsY n=1 Tax=Ligilactobacillus hayakitensis DSM 18933 = JCM 14209 TaxID=1423755 RepID=A0A0R1WLN2_9LACO|nr:signal recognition particle-docking protein FtsY [Ligilactobacillus hayakitensis]KRM18874.1 cell division protein FtsY [Ligilactobacillus hayakitensis DSM 18933 = JCM 14209]